MILLPIKPKYAFAIEKKQKMVEFRKINFKNKSLDICIVYASSPYKKMIGYFKIENIIEENIEDLWNKYKDIWWIEKKDLDDYYKGKKKWYVIKIWDFFSFKNHIAPKELINNFKIPQSFKYLNDYEQKEFFYNLIF